MSPKPKKMALDRAEIASGGPRNGPDAPDSTQIPSEAPTPFCDTNTVLTPPEQNRNTFDVSELFPTAKDRAFPGGRNNVDLWREQDAALSEARERLIQRLEQEQARRGRL